jgi:hypothetical protein
MTQPDNDKTSGALREANQNREDIRRQLDARSFDASDKPRWPCPSGRLLDDVIERCAALAEERAVKLRTKAKGQKIPGSRQWYFAQASEAKVIADHLRALKGGQ